MSAMLCVEREREREREVGEEEEGGWVAMPSWLESLDQTQLEPSAAGKPSLSLSLSLWGGVD